MVNALSTPLCSMFDIKYPILLAGMGGRGRATPPRLVAAVSEAGGMGFIGGSGLSATQLRERIREVRALTDKPFGVNCLLPVSMDSDAVSDDAEMRERLRREHPDHVAFVDQLIDEYGLERVPPRIHLMSPQAISEQLDVVIEEAPAAFASGLGDASSFIPRAKEAGVTVLGLVGAVRHVARQLEAGADLIVAQGYEAGGHTGKIANFALIPQVVAAADPVPVIAAGGIADGRGVAAALALGASGVWIGTAFLMAAESGWNTIHQDEIRRGASEDFVITKAYTGKTARDYHNEIIDRWEASGLKPLPMPLQGTLMEPFVAAAEAAGRYELVNNPSGQIAGMLDQVRPAMEIVERLVSGAVREIGRLASYTDGRQEKAAATAG
jgi:nitronate monooxygenase